MTTWPRVKARLVEHLPTLTGWSAVTMFSGPPVAASAPAAFVTVGFVYGEDFAGSFERVRGLGDIDEEHGTVRSELVCSTGKTDLATVESAVFALADAWQAWVDSDPTLGVLPSGSTSLLAIDVQPTQDGSGASVRLTVTLTYIARG